MNVKMMGVAEGKKPESGPHLFVRSFSEEPKNHRKTAMAAGSYVGVAPMK